MGFSGGWVRPGTEHRGLRLRLTIHVSATPCLPDLGPAASGSPGHRPLQKVSTHRRAAARSPPCAVAGLAVMAPGAAIYIWASHISGEARSWSSRSSPGCRRSTGREVSSADTGRARETALHETRRAISDARYAAEAARPAAGKNARRTSQRRRRCKGRSASITVPWWRAIPRRASESAAAASLRRPTPGSRSGPRPKAGDISCQQRPS
jgi:hypothetical protein